MKRTGRTKKRRRRRGRRRPFGLQLVCVSFQGSAKGPGSEYVKLGGPKVSVSTTQGVT